MSYRAFEASPARLIAVSSLTSLALVAVSATFIYFSVEGIVSEQTASATKINISGQQRMLSQQAAYYATEFARNTRNDDRDRARESIARLRQNHDFLLAPHFQGMGEDSESPLSNPLRTLFFEAPYQLDRRLDDYTETVNAVLSAGGEASRRELATLKTKSQQILVLFDTVVQQYETESKSKITELTDVQAVIFAAILLFVVVQIVFVVRPLLRVSERLTERLQEEANRDYLTGLYNRRIFQALGEQAISMSLRNNQPVSLLIFDIDDFKKVNDRYGHTVGDDVIRAVADIIVGASRASDEVFRFGGEEFVILLPQTDRDGAMLVAEKIRQSVRQASESGAPWPCVVTVSGGVTTQSAADQRLDDLLKHADMALYRAKGEHKNRIVAL